MHTFFTTGILILISFLASAQPTVEWQKVLGGTELDAGQDIKQTSDGGYIAFGMSNSDDGDVLSNLGGFDLWIVRLFPDGSLNWKKSIGGIQSDYGRCIQETNDGGFVLVGSSRSSNPPLFGNHGGRDLFVMKLSSDGVILWFKFIGGSEYDAGYSIQQTTDGGFIVAGISDSNDGDLTGNNGNIDVWILKLSNTGNIQWQKSLGGSGNDHAYSIQQANDGGYIIAGSSESNNGDLTNNFGGWDCWVVKLSGSGDIQWQRSYGGDEHDFFYSVQQTTDGGYILSGHTFSSNEDVTINQGGGDIWVVKINSTGQVEWQKTLGGSEWDTYGRVRQTSDGGYIVSASIISSDGDVSFNHGNSDIWLVKLTNAGAISWEKSFGGGGIDYSYNGNGLEVTTDGGVILIATTSSADGDVTSSGEGGNDWWILKLSSVADLHENSEQTQLGIYPNPAAEAITLNTISKQIGSMYTIHDYTGSIVSVGEIREETTRIAVSEFTAGIYVVQIQTEDGMLTSKFVKR